MDNVVRLVIILIGIVFACGIVFGLMTILLGLLLSGA